MCGSVYVVHQPSRPIFRANAFAERLRLGLAVIHGEPKDTNQDDDGRNSPPPPMEDGAGNGGSTSTLPSITPSKKGAAQY